MANLISGARATQVAVAWEMRTRGLTSSEAEALVLHPQYQYLIERHEAWRATYGFPAKDSPIARGHLNDLVAGKEPT